MQRQLHRHLGTQGQQQGDFGMLQPSSIGDSGVMAAQERRKGHTTILPQHLHPSSTVISSRKRQCPQSLSLAQKRPLMNKKNIPVKLKSHHSPPAPRPVCAGCCLTILPHVPCSLKAPGDHRCGLCPLSPLSLFPGLHQEVFIKCQSDK